MENSISGILNGPTTNNLQTKDDARQPRHPPTLFPPPTDSLSFKARRYNSIY